MTRIRKIPAWHHKDAVAGGKTKKDRLKDRFVARAGSKWSL